MKKSGFIIIISIICFNNLCAINTHKTDSLQNLLKTVKKNEKAKLLNELAKAYLPNFAKKTKENASLALQLARKQNNRIEQAYALKYTGIALYYQSKYEEALEYYNNSLNIFKELDNKPEIANILNNIGLIYYELNNYKDALEYHQKSLKIKEEIGNKKGVAKSLNNIGIIYYELNNYKDALEYYQKSLKVKEEIKDKKGIAYALNNIGNIYRELNNYEDALEYYQKSLKIKEEIKDKKGITYALNNIGNIYKELNNYKDALEYYQKSLKIKKEIGDKKGVAKSLNNIGEIYSKLGNFSEALLYFDKSLEIANFLETKDIIIDNYELFSETYSAMGNYKKAFEYHKQYTALKDSVFSSEIYRQIANIKAKYETEKKDKQIQRLEYENNIKTIKINHHKNTHKIYTIVLILAIAFITIILIQYRIKNIAYKFLVAKNLDVLSKEQEMKKIKEKIPASVHGIVGENENEKEEILKKLEQLLDNEKIFRDFDLTIVKLAKRLSTNRTYLSQIINDKLGKNYSDFINEYRVKEAMLLLSDPRKSSKLSIAGIAKEVGFNSIPSFNTAFKKYTGITPSNFKAKATTH